MGGVIMANSRRRSKLQKRILNYLYITNKPVKTLQEIADKVNAYPSSVSRSIKLLQKEGLIEKNSSGYQLTEKRKKIIKYPFPTFAPLQPPIDLSTLKLPEEFSSSLKNIQGVVGNWNRQMAAMYQAISEPIQALQEAYKEMMRPVREFAELLKKQVPYYVRMTNQVFVSLKKQDERGAAMLQEINKELIPHGWIFSPSLPVLSIEKIYLQLKDKGVEEIIEIITEYFSNKVCKEIIQSICSKSEFSAHSHLIRDAFQAHCDGKYTLSIPVFLAQAEGTFIEHFQDKLYSTKKKKYLRKNSSSFTLINVMVESFENFIRDVLAESYCINKKIPEGIFARHPILHGRSVGYGTKENSIKAILLLDYVSFIISRHEKIAISI